MMIVGLLLIGLVIYLVVEHTRRPETKDRTSVDESLNILNLRFARGEIGEEEYRARKAAILK